jgi:hypothetical protein
MNWKETYTKIFLTQLGKDTSELTVKEHMPVWWQNTRIKGSGGLRLTDAGLEAINEIGISNYEIPYPKDMPFTTQIIIFLDKFIDCPYYTTKTSIIVTNEKKAVELTLFAGDLKKYGLAKALSRSKKS